MIMTTYNTTSLTAALLGDEAIESPAAKKSNTRTIRKFLRDELGGGKAVVGKGSRYSLDYNKRELTALKKKFTAWEIEQEEAKAARAAALEAAKAPTEAIILPNDENGEDEEALRENEESDNELEGPSDEEIAEMLSDEDEADIED